MQTITTRTAMVNCLVEQGAHAGLAKAMVTEFYSAEQPDDLLYEGSDAACPVAYTPEEATAVFNNICQGYQAHVTPEGISFDGGVAFNLEGEYL